MMNAAIFSAILPNVVIPSVVLLSVVLLSVMVPPEDVKKVMKPIVLVFQSVENAQTDG
jgi:hypothetical protein